jgi:hypothetical protein
MAVIRFSRRRLLKQGAAATVGVIAGGVISGEARSSSAEERGRFVGTFESVDQTSGSVSVEGLGTIDLVLAPDANVTHSIGDDPSSDLSAFRAGDTIGFDGDLSNGVVRATSVKPVYTRLTGVVLEDTGDVIRTTIGPIRVATDTRDNLPNIEEGKTLVAVVSWHSGDDPLLVAWDLP